MGKDISKEKILETAFMVWGKSRFKNTSLTLISNELNITKTALYRYFNNKNSIIEEMIILYYNEVYNLNFKFIELSNTENDFEKIIQNYIEIYIDFFHKKPYYLYYYTLALFDRSKIDKDKINENTKDVINLFQRFFVDQKEAKTFLFYIFVLIIFFINIYLDLDNTKVKFKDYIKLFTKDVNDINSLKNYIFKQIKNGFIQSQQIINLDYENIIKTIDYDFTNLSNKRDKILNAIAEVVSENGIFNTSTEKIAKKLNMTKSSLYFYFKNKNEMINKMLLDESFYFNEIFIDKINKLENTIDKLFGHLYLSYKLMKTDKKIAKILDWYHFQNDDFHSSENFLKLFKEKYSFLIEALSDDYFLTTDLHIFIGFTSIVTSKEITLREINPDYDNESGLFNIFNFIINGIQNIDFKGGYL